MALFERYPRLAWPSMAILTAVLGGLAVRTFLNYASSPTDENLFANPPDSLFLYVTKAVPGVPVKMTITGAYQATQEADSLRVGDLLKRIDRTQLASTNDLASALNSIAPDSSIVLHAYRPKTRSFLNLRVTRRMIPDSAAVFIKDFICVIDVTSGGASDRAGMKVGDLLVRINGKTFTNAASADIIMRQGQIGKTIIYEAIRNNEHLTLNVTLASFGFPFALLILSFSGMFMMGVGAFIPLRRPRLKAARAVGVALLLLGYAVAVAGIHREPDLTPLLRIRDFLVGFSILAGAATAGWSRIFFPKERADLVSRHWIGWGAVALTTVATVLWRVLGDLILIYSLIGLILYFVVISYIYRKGSTPEHKRMARPIKWTSLLAGCSVAGMMTLALVVGGDNLTLLGVVGTVLLAIPCAYLYTIGRYRLLDLDLRIRRNIQYSLISVAWGILAAVVLVGAFATLPRIDLHLPAIVIHGSSIEAFDDPSSALAREWTNRIALMCVGVVIWYILWRLRKAGQNFIDRKYYRAQYDYRHAVAELGEVLSTKLSMADLGQGLTEKLAELVKVKRAGVFFFRHGAVSACREASGIASGEWNVFCSGVEGRLFSVLEGAGEQLNVDYLPDDLKESFRSHQFQLIVPFRSHSRLIGAMVLGEKLSEATYDREDFEFLSAASAQAAGAMENAFLYEELAEKERMKHELEIARRIQLASLPQQTPVVHGLDVAGTSVPALEVGGDFFDYLNGRPNHMTIIVGDVSGKGTSAALYMSKVQGILRSLHGFGLSPADLFIRANRLLCADLEKSSFVTAVGAAFDTEERTVVLARAGHLPLYHYHAAEATMSRVVPRGLGLGLNNAGVFSSEIEEKVVQYGHGDVLLFVTDGVTEALDPSGEQFGEERLLRIVTEEASGSAGAILDAVLKRLSAFSAGAHQHDDETIVVVKGT